MGIKIVLILDKKRIKVDKEKLASKSHYFASLFSHNFNDSHKTEHVINYDISFVTLKNFVTWIQDNGEYNECECHRMRICMTKYVKKNFTELLSLLQLSILFTVDELRNNIIELIASFWLLPNKIIDIWLLAQELNVKVLKDISLSVCLDRFEELPLPSLVELSKENVTLLLQNVNVRSSIEHLTFVRQEWIVHNKTSDIPEIKPERQVKYMLGVVAYTVEETFNRDPYLYIWNDNVFSDCAPLKAEQHPEKGIVGMQVVARGFSVYTVGGEMGLGTGRFNNYIWRYCLLSKKWYYQATLLCPRRHMVAVFLGNKLIIVGGVGRHRLKLDTVHILDVHTGEWERGEHVPESFTEVPPHCVLDGKLFLTKSLLYIYYPQIDYWQTVMVWNMAALGRVDTLLCSNATFFFVDETDLGETVLSRVDILNEPVCKKKDCLTRYVEHCAIPINHTVFEMDSHRLLHVEVTDIGVLLLNDGREQYLHVHTELKEDFDDLVVPTPECINIIDPNTLYNTV